MGFVKEFTDVSVLNGSNTITGTVTSLHNSRPPDFQFFSGQPVGNCYVGLNDRAVGIGIGVFVDKCDANSEFSIPNVPPGDYELVIWDQFLTMIIGSLGITVDGSSCNGASCALGDVPIFAWFNRMDTATFADVNENGFWDVPAEPNLPADSAGYYDSFSQWHGLSGLPHRYRRFCAL